MCRLKDRRSPLIYQRELSPAHLVFLWLAYRRGSDMPLNGRLWNVVGGLLWGVGWCLIMLGPSDQVQVVGFVLFLAAAIQSTVWTIRLHRRGRDKRAVHQSTAPDA